MYQQCLFKLRVSLIHMSVVSGVVTTPGTISVLTKNDMEVETVTKCSSILADVCVLYATWKASGNTRALAERISGKTLSLVDVLLADGMFG